MIVSSSFCSSGRYPHSTARSHRCWGGTSCLRHHQKAPASLGRHGRHHLNAFHVSPILLLNEAFSERESDSFCFTFWRTVRVSPAGWRVRWRPTPSMWCGPAWWTSGFCQEARCTKEPWTGWCRRGGTRASLLCIRDSGQTGCDWDPGTSSYPLTAPTGGASFTSTS